MTQHVDDLYPVPAFRLSGGPHTPDTYWLRETEGPEDTFDGRKGKCEFLYRPPTHWQPLPESPWAEAREEEKPVIECLVDIGEEIETILQGYPRF